jgi:hypothetical protein
VCAWNHRFDDARRRFRTVYCAERPETSLREVLADFRPNLSAQRAFAEAFGAAALEDLPAAPVTARWREEHLLASAELVLDGELIDLTDPAVRADLEQRHASLLIEHGLAHLDLHEITSRRRVVTQTIAADLFERCDAGACAFLLGSMGSLRWSSSRVAASWLRPAIRSRSPTPLRRHFSRSAASGGWSLSRPTVARASPKAPAFALAVGRRAAW